MNKICDVIEAVVKWVGTIMFATMISVVFYEVVMRYIFNSPTFWSEALARDAMIWLVMLGLARGIRNLDNIRVDFLVGHMPEWLQKASAWIRFATLICFSFVMVYHGFLLAIGNRKQIATGFGISVMFIYIAVPVSGILILLFALELILKRETRPF